MARFRIWEQSPLFFLLLLMVFIGGWTFSPRDVSCKRSQMIMDTVFSVIVYGQDKSHLEKSVEAAFEEVRRIEKLTDRYDTESLLSLFNSGRLPPAQHLSPEQTKSLKELYELLERTCSMGRATGGLFDPTLGPVIDLWKFKTENPIVPLPEQVKEMLSLTGLDKITFLPDGTPSLVPRVLLNLSGVAKGYAVDRAVMILRQRGIKHCLVDGGGEVRAIGGKPGGKPWLIGIKDPRGAGCIGSIEAENLACATSGDYERYFEQAGKRYHHILDPETGFPARMVRSVTVVAPSVFEADILATAAFVGGEAGIRSLSSRMTSAGFVLFSPDERVLCAGQLPPSLLFNPGQKVIRIATGENR